MKVKQNLNNYTEEYKNSDIWEVLETQHYIFHYTKNSVAEKDLNHIAETQERAYLKIIKILKIENKQQKIKYYIYQSEDQKKRLMGDDGFAQAIWHDNSVHIVYTENIKPLGEHEDTHLLTLPWGVAIGFFQEGLAEYTGGCVWGKSKQAAEIFVQKSLSMKKIPDFKFFFSHSFWMNSADENIEYYYPLAGTFTRFLIHKFGLEKYKEFYKKIHRKNTREENIKIFEEAFGCLDNIVKSYLKMIIAKTDAQKMV